MSSAFPTMAELDAKAREHRDDCQCSACMDDVTWLALYDRRREDPCPYCGAQCGQPHHGGCEEVP